MKLLCKGKGRMFNTDSWGSGSVQELSMLNSARPSLGEAAFWKDVAILMIRVVRKSRPKWPVYDLAGTLPGARPGM